MKKCKIITVEHAECEKNDLARLHGEPSLTYEELIERNVNRFLLNNAGATIISSNLTYTRGTGLCGGYPTAMIIYENHDF